MAGYGQRFVSQTMQNMRRFSGKVAAMAGYMPQEPAPPAPYMERYRPTRGLTAVGNMLPPTQVAQYQPWRRSRAIRIVHHMRLRRDRWQQAHPQGKRIWTSLLVALLILLVIVGGSGTAYAYTFYQQQLPKVQQIANKYISQTTRIYDRNMKPLYDVYDTSIKNGGRRTMVSLDQVPQIMSDAMIAAEDASFWTNSGVDPQGISRAVVDFISHKGAVQGGGSTITQQLVKKLTGNDDVSINRKVSEAALAIGLTQQYSKAKILEMYFNVAPFGAQDLGVESATEEYFNLQPQCAVNAKCTPGVANLDLNLDTMQHDPILSLARASLLAGMPQAPGTNDPTKSDAARQRALQRQDYVLNQMAANNMKLDGRPITPEMVKQAEDLSAKMTFKPYVHVKRAKHFVDWVIEQVETQLGDGDLNAGVVPFITGGFNIKTTIDANLEDYVEKAVDRHLNKPEYQYFAGVTLTLSQDNNLHNSAVVVMNAHTGEILAMNGSSDYYSTDPRINGAYNVAAPPNGDLGRPVGSTFKPLVYATAMSMGWYPSMIIPDTKSYIPISGAPAGTPKADQTRLYDAPDYGAPNTNNLPNTTMRVATVNSFNIPAIKAMAYAGVENVKLTTQRLGLTSLNKQNVTLASVLGTNSVPVLQMTDAYQTFANAGQRVPPQSILDIWDNSGHSLYHYDPANPPKLVVFSPQVSYLMTSILIDEPSRRIEFGQNHILSFTDLDPNCAIAMRGECSLQVAAKTGTTDSFKDNWTIGYTPNVVVGVWSGNANQEEMVSRVQYGITGVTGAAPIWHDVIEAASGYCPPADPYLSCPNIDSKALGLSQNKVFAKPNGVEENCTSKVNGLNGGRDNCDYFIKGQYPQQSGSGGMQNPNGGNNNHGGDGNHNNPPNNNGNPPNNNNPITIDNPFIIDNRQNQNT